jgi:ABC-type nitrate/sulfonate/bicarbonate transport system ATPase subunit
LDGIGLSDASTKVEKRSPVCSAKLEVRGLSKRFQVPVLEQLNLLVRPSEFLCLLGPNGCGKTTLLRVLAGLERPDGGTVLLDGTEVDLAGPHVGSIGVVFQEPRLLPWHSIERNIASCLKPLGVTGTQAAERTREVLRLVGLAGFEHYFPGRLSGGMQQRASIARALAVEPEILLMDEPFSALDPENRRIMQGEVARLCRETGRTVVFVTHSIEEALSLGTRVVLFSARPAQPIAEINVDGDIDRQGVGAQLLEFLSEQVQRQRELDRPKVREQAAS